MKFCESSFFLNKSDVLNASLPIIPSCLECSAFVILPNLLLCILAFVHVILNIQPSHAHHSVFPICLVNIFKVIFTILALLLSVSAEVLLATSFLSHPLDVVHILTPLTDVAIFVLFLVIFFTERSVYIWSSGWTFVFWVVNFFSKFLFAFTQFSHMVLQKNVLPPNAKLDFSHLHLNDFVVVILFAAASLLCVIQLILHSFGLEKYVKAALLNKFELEDEIHFPKDRHHPQKNEIFRISSEFVVDSSNSEDAVKFLRTSNDKAHRSSRVNDDSTPVRLAAKSTSLQNTNPEVLASFFSKITFSWFTPLISLGYKKVINAENDLFALESKYDTTVLSKIFLNHLNASKPRKKIFRAKENATEGQEARNLGEQERVYEQKKRINLQRSVAWTLASVFKCDILFSVVFKFIFDSLSFVSPVIFNQILTFVEDLTQPLWIGLTYSISLLLFNFLQTFILHQYFHLVFTLGMRFCTCLMTAVYNKAMFLSPKERNDRSIGEIVNIMSIDCQKVLETTSYINMIWSGPFQIILAITLLWKLLGPSVIVGVMFLVLLIPFNAFISNRIKLYQSEQMKLKDARIKIITEVLNGVKVVKLYAWELSFHSTISKLRQAEVHYLKKINIMNSVNSFVWNIAPFVLSLLTFAVYLLVDPSHVLDAQKAFVSLSLFNLLKFPLLMLPVAISSIVQAKVSIDRINSFLSSDEIDNAYLSYGDKARSEGGDDIPEDYSLVSKPSSYSWNSYSPTSNITLPSLTLKKKELLAIVGSVGSGKSSFISALLGEMELFWSKNLDEMPITIRVGKSKNAFSYVPQVPWIQNASVRNNVTFHKAFQPNKYAEVLSACCLNYDMEILPAGDQTEIGERGINLSGGQKQRLSLARALYHTEADVFVLDDPLSAVDAHVGAHIFNEVIGPNGLLKDKTRIFITHQIHYLAQTDTVILLENGRVLEHGNYYALLKRSELFNQFMKHERTFLEESKEDDVFLSDKERSVPKQSTLDEVKEEEQERMSSFKKTKSLPFIRNRSLSESQKCLSSQELSTNTQDDRSKSVASITFQKRKLIQSEESKKGQVQMRIYALFFKTVGVFIMSLSIFFFILYQACAVGANFWLSAWSSDSLSSNLSATDPASIALRNERLIGYGLFGVGQSIFILIYLVLQTYCFIRCSNILHKEMLMNMLRSPLRFFDTTPLGRIVNRFSKDIDSVDNQIPSSFRSWISTVLSVVSTIFVISYNTPLFLVILVPLAILYIFFLKYYIASSRQFKRIQSVKRSPIFSAFQENISGTPLIHAFSLDFCFTSVLYSNVEKYQQAYYPSITCNRWLAIRLEFIGAFIVFFSALFAILNRFNTITPGLTGLNISYAMSITQSLNWLVRMTGELETNLISIERIDEYCKTPSEADWFSASPTPSPSNKIKDLNNPSVSPSWITKGEISFIDYSFKYRPELDTVLKGISFSVASGEKVGIVGRTGAGKSSISLSLFRMYDPPASGNIMIDGVSIFDLGLHDLRTYLGIIPQDPTLFTGSLRYNLDPFSLYSDADIWRVLRYVKLEDFFNEGASGLDFVLSEGGGNLSSGQGQLLCLARALLKNPKVLLMDEATASIDLQTDEFIQKTIREQFKKSTILTIAHRLDTIIDYDKVLVLENGQILEYASPKTLLEQPSSLFYDMCKKAKLI